MLLYFVFVFGIVMLGISEGMNETGGMSGYDDYSY